MELTTPQIHEVIDRMLPLCNKESNAKNLELAAFAIIQKINPKATGQVERVFKIMQDYDLIKLWSKDSYEITEFGKFIIEIGGWLQYQADKDAERLLDKKIKELTVEQLKKNIFQIKYWWAILIASVVVSVGVSKLFDWWLS